MKMFYFCIAFIVIFIISNSVDKEIRTLAQKDRVLHEVIMGSDLYSFAMNGGGTFGHNNYYKWVYSKWRNDPARTKFEKIMFWNVGFFYDATNPPEKYQYPLLK